MPNSPTHFKEFNLNEYNQIFTNNIINKYTFELNNAENRMKITNNILSAEVPSSKLDNSIKLNLKSGTTSKTVYELNSYSYTGVVNKKTTGKTALLAYSYLTRSGDNIIYGIMDPNDFTHKICESDSSTIVNEKSDVLFGFGNNVSDNDYIAGLSISGNIILGGLGSNTFGSVPIKAKYDYLNWSTKDGILYTKNTNNKIDDVHIWNLENVVASDEYDYENRFDSGLNPNVSYCIDDGLKNYNANNLFDVVSYNVNYMVIDGEDWVNISSINGNDPSNMEPVNLSQSDFNFKEGKLIDTKNKLSNFTDDEIFTHPSQRNNESRIDIKAEYKVKTQQNNDLLNNFNENNYNIANWTARINNLPIAIIDGQLQLKSLGDSQNVGGRRARAQDQNNTGSKIPVTFLIHFDFYPATKSGTRITIQGNQNTNKCIKCLVTVRFLCELNNDYTDIINGTVETDSLSITKNGSNSNWLTVDVVDNTESYIYNDGGYSCINIECSNNFLDEIYNVAHVYWGVYTEPATTSGRPQLKFTLSNFIQTDGWDRWYTSYDTTNNPTIGFSQSGDTALAYSIDSLWNRISNDHHQAFIMEPYLLP